MRLETDRRNEPTSVARPRRRTPRQVADPNPNHAVSGSGMQPTRRKYGAASCRKWHESSKPARGGTGKVLVVLVGPLTTLDSCGRKQTNRRCTAIYTRPNRDIDLYCRVGQVVSRPGRSRGFRFSGGALTFPSQAGGLGWVAAAIAATMARLARRASHAGRSIGAIRISRIRRNVSGNSPYVFPQDGSSVSTGDVSARWNVRSRRSWAVLITCKLSTYLVAGRVPVGTKCSQHLEGGRGKRRGGLADLTPGRTGLLRPPGTGPALPLSPGIGRAPGATAPCDRRGGGKVCDDRNARAKRGMGNTWRRLPYGRATATRWGPRMTEPGPTSGCSPR